MPPRTDVAPPEALKDLNFQVTRCIRELLARQRMSERALGGHLWYDQATISRRMTCKVSWTLAELSCVAEVLGTTVYQLLRAAEQRHRNHIKRPEAQ